MRAVLTYHSIDPSGSPISVHPDAFEHQVRWLASGRVQVVDLEDLMRLPADADAVAVTFDDGVDNFRTRAAPRLRAHGLPATLFVVTGRVGGTNEWSGHPARGIPTLPLLGWEELEGLAASGVTIGAHSQTHPDLTRLGGAALAAEIIGSFEQLRSRLGVVPRTFAYPYGRVNRHAAACVAETFALGCTTDLRALGRSERPELIPRLDMYYFQRPGRLEAWGSPRFERYVTRRRRLRQVRALLAGGS